MQTICKNVGLLLTWLAIHSLGYGQASTLLPSPEGGRGRQMIDVEALRQWVGVGAERDCALSPDGKYATWSIDNPKENKYSLIVASTMTGWKKEFHDEKRGDGFFTENSTQYIFPVNNGLCKVLLGGQSKYIRPVSSWKQDGQGRWLAWQGNSTGLILEDLIHNQSVKLEILQGFYFDISGQWLIGKVDIDGKGLLLHDLQKGRQLRFSNVDNYKLKDDGRSLILLQTGKEGRELWKVELPTGKQQLIHASGEGGDIVNFCLDNTGNKMAFTIRNKEDGFYSYWYYENGAKAVELVNEHNAGFEAPLKLGSSVQFTSDGRCLTFSLVLEADKRRPDAEAVMVDVWSYFDKQFYTAQRPFAVPIFYPAVVSVAGGKVIQLKTQEDEELEGDMVDGYALVAKRQVGDRFWEYTRDSIWLVRLQDGTRTLLPFVKAPWVELRPTERAVVGFDLYRGRHYYRYDIATRKEQKLSATVPDWFLGVENPYFTDWKETEKLVNHVIAARTVDKQAIMVYDSYDIWRIDLSGKKQAVNLTNGYGRRNNLVFRVVEEENELVNEKDPLLLSAFHEQSKENGFYQVWLDKKQDPDSLIRGAYFFSHDRKILGNLMPNPYDIGMKPVKAKKANGWIMRRESATEAPNYFFTRDFKTFNQLTSVQPQKEYNWYTARLIDFTQEDGRNNQAVLYRPANFDSTKKYPVIIYYYEQYTYALNKFIPPAVSEAGKPNIPWFVNHGYLVCTPDIYFSKGWNGRSAVQAVEGVARYLSRLPYVDSGSIGIAGLSMAGGLTNYIITHSNRFAAAFVGCGVSDRVSGALQWAQLGGAGGSRLQGTEQRTGSNMWDSPEQWVGESAILKAHKISTPLLIMHNKADGAVLFEQAVEMFTAMRRLNKKVWLLQYDKGGHGVGGKEAFDLTTRTTQFFDYYLKGAALPRWMMEGIPSHLKGIEDRLELINGSNAK